MAAAVTDGDKDRFVLIFSPLKRFVTPSVPIERIVFVLLQVGGIFEGKTV